MPEIEEDLVVGTFERLKFVNMKTNCLRTNTESENSVTEKKNMKQRSMPTKSGLENFGYRIFSQTVLASSKRGNQEEAIGGERGMDTNRRTKLSKNLGLHNLPWPKIKPGKIHDEGWGRSRVDPWRRGEDFFQSRRDRHLPPPSPIHCSTGCHCRP
jgi:hypothetical protein